MDFLEVEVWRRIGCDRRTKRGHHLATRVNRYVDKLEEYVRRTHTITLWWD
jgi:hypothetical protein